MISERKRVPRRRPPALLVAGLLAASLTLWSAPLRAQVFHDVEGVLSSFFPRSERVSYEVIVTKQHAAKLKQLLGYAPKRPRYVVFVARSGARVDGYAVIDNEDGRYDPITFAIKLSKELRVERTEVMVYRGTRGKEIVDPGFLGQFKGKRLTDPIAVGDGVDAVSGATISSNASAKVVRRALALATCLGRGPGR